MSFIKSEYAQNILTLLSGSVFSQALPVFFAPVTSRIYSPFDYGILGIYMSVAGLLGVLVTSHYFHAILLQKNDKEAISLVLLCQLVNIAVSLLSLLALLIFYNKLTGVFSSEFDTYIWWFLPLTLFLNGTLALLSVWANRKKKYKSLNKSRITQSIIAIAFQIIYGILIPHVSNFRPDFTGLFIGSLIGLITGCIMLYFEVWKEDKNQLNRASVQAIGELIRKEIRFLFYVLPADFINSFINQVPYFMLGKFSSAREVGYFSHSQRFLGLPITFVGTSVLEVFRQKAIADYTEKGECREVFINTFKTLFLLGAVPTIILMLWGPLLFKWVFGEQWEMAGNYARILSVTFWLKFSVSPLTYMYFIAGKQKEDFWLHILMLLTTFISLFLGYYFYRDTFMMILFFSINYSIIYILYGIRSFQFASKIKPSL